MKAADFAHSQYETEYQDQAIQTLDMPYRSLGEETGFIPGNKLKPSRAISPQTVAIFKRAVDDAGDLEVYFSKLQVMGRALSLAAGSTDTQLAVDAETPDGTVIASKQQAVAYLDNLPADELFNTATILKTLAYIAK